MAYTVCKAQLMVVFYLKYHNEHKKELRVLNTLPV